MDDYRVIGAMSGTSLDGLDIACCAFSKKDKWSYRIIKAITLPYPEEWNRRLSHAITANAETLARLNVDYGRFIGEKIKAFTGELQIHPGFIASHGHTVFHQPHNKFTLQIGDGNAIAAQTGLPVIYDFRSLDVALGGQGAPLVPIGDRLLFGEFDFCLNLGGIANISYELNNKRIAFDICPANMLLNHLSAKLNQPFDKGGEIARVGKIDKPLLAMLNGLEYYQVKGTKSLGREWFEMGMLPLLVKSRLAPGDLLRTGVEHIAMQVARATKDHPGNKMLVTGGGALNSFLVSRIRQLAEVDVVVPDDMLVNFKEALVFAFLGVLRLRNEVNCLSSVTGASHDSSSGVVVQ